MAKNTSATSSPARSARSPTTKAPAKPAAPRKAAAVKEATPKPVAVKAAPAKAAAKPRARSARPGTRTIPPEQRRNYIEVAAYYIAARREFAPGDPLQDWIQAEAEIDALLAQGLLGG